MLDFYLLHYLLSSDSEAMTLHKVITQYVIFQNFNKKVYTSPLLNYVKSNTSRFDSTILILPSDIGEYLSPFFNAVYAVVFISIFIL